jgi:hypothetical protein
MTVPPAETQLHFSFAYVVRTLGGFRLILTLLTLPNSIVPVVGNRRYPWIDKFLAFDNPKSAITLLVALITTRICQPFRYALPACGAFPAFVLPVAGEDQSCAHESESITVTCPSVPLEVVGRCKASISNNSEVSFSMKSAAHAISASNAFFEAFIRQRRRFSLTGALIQMGVHRSAPGGGFPRDYRRSTPIDDPNLGWPLSDDFARRMELSFKGE